MIKKKTTKRMCLMLALVMGLMMASCGSKKAVTSGEVDMSGFSETSYLRAVVDNAPDFDEFSAKMRLSLSYGNEDISVNGSIKMKRDEVIQLSLVAVGIVEAARVELTPKHLLVLDRIGRRYVEVKYDDLPFFKESKIDFYTLQALFWNELFLPGVKHVEKDDIYSFHLVRGEKQATLTTEKGKRLSYSFLTAVTTGILEESRIHVSARKENDYQFNWHYRDFLTLDQRLFPASMNLSLDGTEKPIKASFSFSRWETRVEYAPLSVPNRYKRVEVADILKNLLTIG